jgi:hypothetical protein
MNTIPMRPATDPTVLVNNLDADAIEARLEELEAQAKALRVLLRSARARDAARRRAKGKGAGHAAT